jgi:hypothetical protein
LKRGKERREKGEVGVLGLSRPKFKFKFEFFKLSLKIDLREFSEVSNMLKSTWPKFENFRARYARVLEKSLFPNKGAK